MAMGINQTYCGDHFIIYAYIKSCYTTEINVILYIKYMFLKRQWLFSSTFSALFSSVTPSSNAALFRSLWGDTDDGAVLVCQEWSRGSTWSAAHSSSSHTPVPRALGTQFETLKVQTSKCWDRGLNSLKMEGAADAPYTGRKLHPLVGWDQVRSILLNRGSGQVC